jgi:hypothetical protein
MNVRVYNTTVTVMYGRVGKAYKCATRLRARRIAVVFVGRHPGALLTYIN